MKVSKLDSILRIPKDGEHLIEPRTTALCKQCCSLPVLVLYVERTLAGTVSIGYLYRCAKCGVETTTVTCETAARSHWKADCAESASNAQLRKQYQELAATLAEVVQTIKKSNLPMSLHAKFKEIAGKLPALTPEPEEIETGIRFKRRNLKAKEAGLPPYTTPYGEKTDEERFRASAARRCNAPDDNATTGEHISVYTVEIGAIAT